MDTRAFGEEVDNLMRAFQQADRIIVLQDGSKLKATALSPRTIQLTDPDNPDGNTVVVTGGLPTALTWDDVKNALKGTGTFLLDKLRGQNCTPITVETIETRTDGTVKITRNTTMDCKPA
jgi:hypothetical protein